MKFLIHSSKRKRANPNFKRTLPLLLLLCFLFVFTSNVPGQTTRIENFRKGFYSTSSTDSERYYILKLCEQYNSLPSDSLLHYVTTGLTLTPSLSHEFFRLTNFKAIYLLKKSLPKPALKLADSLLGILPSQVETGIKTEILFTKQRSKISLGLPAEALNGSILILEQAEKTKDTASIIRAYATIGWAHLEMGKYADGIRWMKKSFPYLRNDKPERTTSVYSNMASCFNNLQETDSAFYYSDLAIATATHSENLSFLANAYNIKAAVYLFINQFKQAEDCLLKALKARQQCNDSDQLIGDMGQLASFHASMKNYEKGIVICKEAIAIAKENNNLGKQIFLQIILCELYQKSGKKDKCIEALMQLAALKETNATQNSHEAIAEMEAKYELQKKESIISQQASNLKINRILLLSGFITFILASIISWLLYRNYKHRQQIKLEQALANEKLQTKLAVQGAEEKERKRIAADLHDNLGAYAAAITSNVNYLKQNDSDQEGKIISQLEENAQGVVTQLSDTIWVLKNEVLSLTSMADRFKSWMQRIMQNYPQITYHYQENITEDIELNPGKALNIFLILKESLTNALKHSYCSEVNISITCNPLLLIRIEDNGRGFDEGHVVKGSGLGNMKERANNCSLLLSFEKAPKGGSIVVISQTTTN